MGGEKDRAGAPGRAKPLREAAAANDTGAAFTLTRSELAALVAAAVGEALEKGAGAPLLVDKQALAQRLGCSPAHIDALRKRGLPVVMVGQLVRFEPERVVEWLRGHAAS
jgi:hypothetical protein